MNTKEKKRRAFYTAVTFLVCVCCTACQKNKDQEKAIEDSAKESAVALALQIDQGQVTPEAIVMAVGEEAVTCMEAQFYLQQVKEKYEPALGDKIWDITIEDGETFEDYVKEEVISEITEVKIICQEAKKQKIELTSDEIFESSSLAADYIKKITQAGENPMDITEDAAAEIYGDHLLAEKMFNVSTGSVNTSISDEEARQITIQYVSILTNGTDKNGAVVKMTPKEKKKAKERAEEFYKQAKETKSFYNYAEENSDDAVVEITFGQENKPEEFGDKAFSLKQGEISEIIEGESGYYILYCVSSFDEDATDKRKENIIKMNQDEVFQQAYREWSKNYEVLISTTLWEQMKL